MGPSKCAMQNHKKEWLIFGKKYRYEFIFMLEPSTDL